MAKFASLVMAALAIAASIKATVSATTQNKAQSSARSKRVTLDTLLQDYVLVEQQASQAYLAYAHFFGMADVALPGMRKYFQSVSSKEYELANKLMDYLNKRGKFMLFKDIRFWKFCHLVRNATSKDGSDKTFCICKFLNEGNLVHRCKERKDWRNALMAMRDHLEIEEYLYTKAKQVRDFSATDPVTRHLLEDDYLSKNVDTIKKLKNYITQLHRFHHHSQYAVGEYEFDGDIH